MRSWRSQHPDAEAERRWRLAIALREVRMLAELFGDAIEEVSTVNKRELHNPSFTVVHGDRARKERLRD
jgi:hypothetical protein